MGQEKMKPKVDDVCRRQGPTRRPTRYRQNQNEKEQREKIGGIDAKDSPRKEDQPPRVLRSAMAEVNTESGNNKEHGDAKGTEMDHGLDKRQAKLCCRGCCGFSRGGARLKEAG